MGAQEQERKDWLGRGEALAKILATLCAGFAAVAIPFLVSSHTEDSRRTEAYMKILTEREQADTSMRQEMFKTLLTGYLTDLKRRPGKGDVESFRNEILLLQLLVLNFQEFLNAKPLFEDVYERLERQRPKGANPGAGPWKELEDQLIKVARTVAAKQSIMLNSHGAWPIAVSKGQSNCVRLYSTEEPDQGKKCPPDAAPLDTLPKGITARSSLKVELQDVKRASVTVKVTPYRDLFRESFLSGGNVYQDSKAGATSEFEVSYFDLPYTDNTQLADGERYALRLKNIYDDTAHMEVIVFKNDFMSVRDRPALGETLEKLRKR
jgi:hypothetical protein